MSVATTTGGDSSSGMTRAIGLPVLLVCALFGVVGPSPLFGFAFALVVLVSLVVRQRAEASRFGELWLCLVVAMMLGSGMGALVPRVAPAGTLKAGWAALAAGALGVVMVRMWLAAPRGGVGATLAVSLLALAFCGGVQSGWLFPTVVVLFFVTGAWALRRADGARAPWRAWRRYLGAGAVMVVTGAAAGGGWALSLPDLYDWVAMKIMQRQHDMIGFSDRLSLGALDGLLESDKIVMRVHGSGVDHLRGIVYSHYFLGRWTQVQEDVAKQRPFPTAHADDAIEIELVESDSRYYFLPLGARDIALSSGVALVDRSEVVGPLASDPATRLWFHWRPENRSRAAPPDSGDLELTWRVMRALRPLAKEWTASARTTEQALALLEGRLMQHARYSLHVAPRLGAGADPVVDFVLRGKQGHCEYFASAMAVMARTLGIATRVVGGYRVVERNPWGGYWLVRERDAHTWVEAWVPGKGWRQYDPTPAAADAALARTTTGAWGGGVDAILSGWSDFRAWLLQRSWLEVLTPLVLLVLLFLVQRLWRRRRAGPPAETNASLGFREFSVVMAQAGVGRRQNETLHDYAQRLARVLPAELSAAAGVALGHYAALRYGGRGEPAQVDRQLRAVAGKIRGRSPAGSG